jgi:hypothetical protein
MKKSEAATCITFQIPFFDKLGCRIQGDGPVVISEIVDSNVFSENQNGKLNYFDGSPSSVRDLCDQGLRPRVGDVLVSLDDTVLIHLNSSQVQSLTAKLFSFYSPNPSCPQVNRLIKSLLLQRKERDHPPPIQLVLRRYDVSKEADLLKHDRKVKLIEEELLKSSDRTATAEKSVSVDSTEESKTETVVSRMVPEVLTVDEAGWDHQRARVDLHCKISVDHEISASVSRLESQVFFISSEIFDFVSLDARCSSESRDSERILLGSSLEKCWPVVDWTHS